jgi:hypothetical protein
MSMHPHRMWMGVEDEGGVVVMVTETCTIVVVNLMCGSGVWLFFP